jgi:2-polyprenyl-6-methoxyphenol hydroxylase-like FAD-dependent oxidoreductase/SAM-dependent methyltransferase
VTKLKLGIVGAGLAGLAAAAGADPRRVDVTVLERNASIEPLGGGLILQPNAVCALRELGCLDPVRRLGAELTHLVQRRNGTPVEIRLGDVWPRLGLPTLAAHRHAVHRVLLDRVSAHAQLELSQEVRSLERSESGRPAIGTADGTVREFDLVVGADGIQSTVRDAVAPASTVRELGLWWARWLVAAGSPIDRKWQTERVGSSGVGTFPLGGDELQIFATIPGAEMGDGLREQTLSTLLQQSRVLGIAAEHGMQLVHVGPAREVWPHAWGTGGVVLAGDAAHAMPPTLSAGGGMAIEDGLVFARLLNRSDTTAGVAERYESLRRKRLAWMAKVGRVQVSTVGGSPSPADPSQLSTQMRRMYEPLDDPRYLSTAARVEWGGDFYERTASKYSQTRRTEPRIAAELWRGLGEARSVLNVGAGVGAYEPADREVVGVEPAAAMRALRPTEAGLCVAGVAEDLPFETASFDAVMSVFSHWHWKDEAKGFAEMRRVARDRVVVLTMDRSVAEEFWLAREYLPSAHDLWGPFERTLEWMDPCEMIEIPIPADCIDGFFHAYWRRPRAYLDRRLRESMAVFARLGRDEERCGLDRLAEDLRSGRWHELHADLLEQPSLDLGCRLLVHSSQGGAS